MLVAILLIIQARRGLTVVILVWITPRPWQNIARGLILLMFLRLCFPRLRCLVGQRRSLCSTNETKPLDSIVPQSCA